jgi:hypothetical protein
VNRLISRITIPFLTYLFFFFILSTTYANALTIFEDDFESGNVNQWTSVRGPAALWEMKYSDISESTMYGARILSPSTLIDSVAKSIQITEQNYKIDFDYIPIEGADNNFDFRWKYDEETSSYYVEEVHYLNENYAWNNFNCEALTNSPLAYGQVNHISAVFKGSFVSVTVNGIKIIECIDNNYPIYGHDYIGARIGTGGSYPKEGWFDNFRATTLDDEPIPTPTPSIIPSPSPTIIPEVLNVPMLKQTTFPWGLQTYDSANKWTKNLTVSSWGCALTSAAMVLQYHGFKLLPDGTTLNPGTLNTWLKSQKDGYIGEGFVNWLSLSRLSKLSKTINKIDDFDALEYVRKNTTDMEVLKNDLRQGNPDILEEPGHFIVAKGIRDNTILINDPYFNRQTLNDGYLNTFMNIGSYSRVSSDLSYILIVSDSVTKININNEAGESFVQQPLIDDLKKGKKNAPLRFYYLRKPEAKKYELQLSTQDKNIVNVAIYLYDQYGSVYLLSEKILLTSKPKKIQIKFNKNDIGKSTIKRTISIDDIITEIKYFRKFAIFHNQTRKHFEKITKDIERDLKIDNRKGVKITLLLLQKLVRNNPLIDSTSEKILLSDTSALLESF